MSPPSLFIQPLMRCRISWPGPVCLHERVRLPANRGGKRFFFFFSVVKEDYSFHSAAQAAGLIPERGFICSERKQTSARGDSEAGAGSVPASVRPVRRRCTVYHRRDSWSSGELPAGTTAAADRPLLIKKRNPGIYH